MTRSQDTSVTAPSVEKPLAGLTVLVTRARSQSETLAGPLEELGAEVLAMPVIELAEPVDSTPLEAAIRNLSTYDWLVLTSVNGVERFLPLVEAVGPVGEQLAGVKVAVVGSATADRLREHGIEPDLIPASYRAEGLADAFLRLGSGVGRRVLIPRAAEARGVLPEELRSTGTEVDAVDLYRLVPAEPDPDVLARIAEGTVDVLTFASGATARHFVAVLEAAGIDAAAVFSAAAVASVGPVTSAAIRALDFEVEIEAASSTISDLVDAIVDHFGRDGS